MLKTLRNAFKIKDIRKKLLYTFAMLVVIRIGSQLPIPGVETAFFKDFFAQQNNDAFGFFNAMTGSSFTNMSVFALSITPYITSSIIMQLLTIAIPKLEEMQRDGEDGRKKIAEYTRYVTVALALIESIAMAIGFGGQGLLSEFNAISVIIAVVTMTAGSALLMWIGERITENGVGNGISIVLLFNIISSLPSDASTLYTRFMSGQIGCSFRSSRHYHCGNCDCDRGICRCPSGWREKNSGPVFQKDAGTQDGWRPVLQHPVESKYSRCYPGYLCFLHHVLPGSNCPVLRQLDYTMTALADIFF